MSAISPSSVRLDHERLDLYAVVVELDEIISGLARRGPRGHAWLWDQAQRAPASAVLNIAEAAGARASDRARCLRIARGSMLETDAALTLLADRGACPDDTRRHARNLTVRTVSMVTRLITTAA